MGKGGNMKDRCFYEGENAALELGLGPTSQPKHTLLFIMLCLFVYKMIIMQSVFVMVTVGW